MNLKDMWVFNLDYKRFVKKSVIYSIMILKLSRKENIILLKRDIQYGFKNNICVQKRYSIWITKIREYSIWITKDSWKNLLINSNFKKFLKILMDNLDFKPARCTGLNFKLIIYFNYKYLIWFDLIWFTIYYLI